MTRRLCLLALCVFAGCQQLLPDFSRPGTAPLQQRRAVLHDPFPDPTIGPPVVGGRPREFIVPQPEAVKNRSFVDMYQPR